MRGGFAAVAIIVTAVVGGNAAAHAFELDVDPEKLDLLDGKRRIVDLAVGDTALASVFSGCNRDGKLFVVANQDVMDPQYEGMTHLRLKRLDGDQVELTFVDKSTARADLIDDLRRVLSPSPCENNELLSGQRYTYFEVATVDGMTDAAAVLKKFGLGP